MQNRDNVAKDSRNQVLARAKVSSVQELLTLAGGDEPIAGAEAALKPVREQIPLNTEPVEIPHAAVTARALPDFSRDKHKLSPLHGNLLLFTEHRFQVAQSAGDSFLLGSLDHGLTTATIVVPFPKELMNAGIKFARLGLHRLEQLPAGHVPADLSNETENRVHNQGNHCLSQFQVLRQADPKLLGRTRFG